jgi:hypothetical protein
MFPYNGPPDPPYKQDGPPSRLEVQQHYLDHQKDQYREFNLDLREPGQFPLGGLVLNLRRSFGNMLIILGRWMVRETARNATGPEIMARR